MLLSVVSVLVVAQSSSEIPEGLMNNPVHLVVPYSHCAVKANGALETQLVLILFTHLQGKKVY